MGLFRTIYCSACGTAWRVAHDLGAGRDVRCKQCFTVFPVPLPIANVPVLSRKSKSKNRQIAEDITPEKRTPAQLMDVDDFPTDLRRALSEGTTDPVVIPPSEAQTRPGRPALGLSREEAARIAFDLDAQNDPLRRTGAGLLRVPKDILEDYD